MDWQEECIVLGIKPFSEKSRIVTIFSSTFGIVSGVCNSNKFAIQIGDISNVSWKGNNIASLGRIVIENIFSPFIYLARNAEGLFALESACSLCRQGLPEGAPHRELFDQLRQLILGLIDEQRLKQYLLFEITFLAAAGMGLDFSKCAITGQKGNLAYISARTGRCVIKEVGEQYWRAKPDHVFKLPRFLTDMSVEPTNEDILAALNITGHFLRTYFCGINGGTLPLYREYLLSQLRHNNTGEANENWCCCQ